MFGHELWRFIIRGLIAIGLLLMSLAGLLAWWLW